MAAVQATVIGYYSPKYIPLTCSTQSPRAVGVWVTCPFTARFRLHVAHRGVQLCPEQFGPRTVKLHTVRIKGATALIDARWDMGPQMSYVSTFVVVHVKRSWLVDNEYLAGKPSSSIDNRGAKQPCH